MNNNLPASNAETGQTHTPTPWKLIFPVNAKHQDIAPRIIEESLEARGGIIATLGIPFNGKRNANASFIVEACNSHARLLAQNEAMRRALEEIAKGEGAFSRDPLNHACNTIDNMKELAVAALAANQGAKSP